MTNDQWTLITHSMALHVGTQRFLPPGRPHGNFLDTSGCMVTVVPGVREISVVAPRPRKLHRAADLATV
jgi:hypothetical protein